MDQVPKFPVLITGAGPSGLVLALALRKNGIPVRIIDKELQPRRGERGSGVSARSLELYKILGTFTDVYGSAKPIPLRREYDPLDPYKPLRTFAMVPQGTPTIGAPNADFVSTGQNHHERILREHLAKHDTEVEFGTELRSFTQSDNTVNVEIVHHTSDGKEEVEQSSVSWLIGTDGGHSTVRKALGLEFLGDTREDVEMIIGDFKYNGETREYWEFWGDPKDKIAFIRQSSQDADVLSFLLVGNVDAKQALSSPQATIDAFYKITGRRDIVLEDVIWSSRYRPNIRMVKQFRVGRVFLAGDAAHCHSPAGGQGLNSSIQDSFNLGWKLALVERGLAKESLLNTYSEERLPVIAQMLNKTTELLELQFGTDTPPETQRAMRADMSQLCVTYRGSSIVLQDGVAQSSVLTIGYNSESVDAAQAGDRAPEAPGLISVADGETLNVYRLLSPSRHIVLIFANGYSTEDLSGLAEILLQLPENTVNSILIHKDKSDSLQDDNGKFDKILVDDKGHAYDTYKIGGPTIVVVRPDGVIGARVIGVPSVRKYFSLFLERA